MKQKYKVVPILDQKSNFFCAAKWTELFLYLNHGLSNSCHHPIPHKIPEELLTDPYVLHNTPHKLKMQELMMQGQRPDECHMCWHIEDSDPHVVSDRILKSELWKEDIDKLVPDIKHVPKLIEVVFDNYCNLKCSYCDGGQSSSWAAKIKQHPLLLDTDYRNLYSKVSIAPGSTKKEYLDAWQAWWPEIKDQVKILKVSGGEPLLSKNFWNFLKTLALPTTCNLSINSNFSISPNLVDAFTKLSNNFNNVMVGVSVDATGALAEYARQGLDYNLLHSNIIRYLDNSDVKFKLYLQSTVNVFSVWGFTDMLDLHVELKQQYPDRIANLYSTVVRFPEFQNVLLLPEKITQDLAAEINHWLMKNQQHLNDYEQSIVGKIATYLHARPTPMRYIKQDLLVADLKKFIDFYNTSSNHNYRDVFPEKFVNWIDLIT